MRATIIGDVHLADHAPSIRRETYLEEILAKLDFAVQHANEKKMDVLIQAGDLIHIKAPSRTSHETVQKTIDVLQSANMPVLIVPGNHDMQNDRIKSLPKQPLGTICKAPGVDMLMGWHEELPVFGLPYLWDYPVLLPQWMKKWTESATDTSLMVTHAPLFPPGEEVIYDFVDSADWAKQQKLGHCYYGHIHDPHGAYVAGGVTFCNQGALSRGSLHEATLKRKPAITDYDSADDQPFTRVEVPHKPASEVFRLKEKEDVDARQGRVVEFLDGIEQTVLETLTVEEVVAHAEKMELKPQTLEQIRLCIEEVSSRG